MTPVYDLKVGDRFLCPVTGKVETVRRSAKGAVGRWSVRTDRHDHHFRTYRTVEVVR